MKLNFNIALVDATGKAIINADKSNGALTLKHVAIDAMLTSYPSDDLKATDALFNFAVATKIWAGIATDYSPEEIALIRARIGKNPVPSVVTSAYAALDKQTA